VNRLRRGVLKGALAVAGGVLASWRALAAEWAKTAFESHRIDEALENVFGSAQMTASASVKITAPYQAENGASVRLVATADLPNVSALAVLVEKNERPLILAMSFNGTQPYVSLRMKMAQTSDVYVVARSQGKLYSARQNIKVTVGGCGG